MNVVLGDLTQEERNFNRILRTIRQIVEQNIGILKMRFRCILGERKLRYNPSKASKIIITCATLHNFLILNRFNIFHGINDNEIRNVIGNEVDINVLASRDMGIQRRNELIRLMAQRMN